MWRESALLHLRVTCFTSDKGNRFVSIMKYIYYCLWSTGRSVDQGGGYDKLHQ